MRAKLPLFPLPNVILFPDAILPLHIFEPRYKLMVEEAILGRKQIGMVLLKKGWEDKYFENPAIYEVGGVGEIVDQERLQDGRFNILLKGVSRFAVSKIVQPKPYQQARVSLMEDRIEDVSESESEKTKKRLGEAAAAIMEYFVYNKMKLNRVPVEFAAPLPTVVDTLSYFLAIDPYEKQPILEEIHVGRRAALLYEKMVELLMLKKTFKEAGNSPGDPNLN